MTHEHSSLKVVSVWSSLKQCSTYHKETIRTPDVMFRDFELKIIQHLKDINITHMMHLELVSKCYVSTEKACKKQNAVSGTS